MKKNTRRDFLQKAGLAALIPVLPSFAASNTFFPEEQVLVKPPALKKGDTIAISSPAGAVWDEKQVGVFSQLLKQQGFKVRLGKTLSQKYGYFAGNDDLRAAELNEFFEDKTVNGIFCMKGGWGCARILDKINYNTIAKNPKVLMGFSDITSLLIAINAKTGLATFHGPVGNSGWNDFTLGYFQSILIKKELTLLSPGPAIEDKPITITPGKAKGILIGGNLTVLASIVGSGYLPSWKNKLLFLEEKGEEPYRVDRMFTQLKLAGVLKSISGIVIGKCVKCEAEEPEKAFTLQQVLQQHIQPLGIPAFYGAMIGHIENKLTLPLGINAEMDADLGTLRLLETAVV